MSLENSKALLRRLAATPIQLPNNVHEVAKLRHETLQKAEALNDSALKAGRDFTSDEQASYDSFVEVIKACSGRLGSRYGQHSDTMAVLGLGGREPQRAAPRRNGGISIVGVPEPEAEGAMEEIKSFMRGGRDFLATSTPLHIQVAPVSGGLAAAIPNEILDAETTYFNLDSFRLAGATIYNTDNTVPLIKPIISAGPDADKFTEGQSATDSHPMAIDSFTFGGQKYSRLVRVSEESLMNSALDLSAAILDELAASVATTFTKDVSAAMVTALHNNVDCYVSQGSDPYHSLLALTTAPTPRYDKKTNVFMLSRRDLLICKDSRDSIGRPLFDDETNQLFGHDYVINDNLSRVVYGDWASGAYLRKTAFTLFPLRELFSASGELGFKATQFLDSKFLASVTGLPQPLFYTNLETAGS